MVNSVDFGRTNAVEVNLRSMTATDLFLIRFGVRFIFN